MVGGGGFAGAEVERQCVVLSLLYQQCSHKWNPRRVITVVIFTWIWSAIKSIWMQYNNYTYIKHTWPGIKEYVEEYKIFLTFIVLYSSLDYMYVLVRIKN